MAKIGASPRVEVRCPGLNLDPLARYNQISFLFWRGGRFLSRVANFYARRGIYFREFTTSFLRVAGSWMRPRRVANRPHTYHRPNPSPQRNLWRAPYYVADPAGASMTIVKRKVFENATPTSLLRDQETFKIVCVSLNTTSAIPSWLG